MSKGSAAPPAEGQGENLFWFTVKYGDDQTALFNADCWAQARCTPAHDPTRTHPEYLVCIPARAYIVSATAASRSRCWIT